MDSIWQTDRIVGRQPFLETMTTMAALAGRTRRMRFGMNVVSLAFRDPVLLAKQYATIDMLSDGRLLPAFGIGSPLAPNGRRSASTPGRAVARPTSASISSAAWARGVGRLQRRLLPAEGRQIAPKPVKPDLPMWIRGSTDAAIRRTARIGTGWQAGGDPPAEAGRVVAAIKAAAREAGRSIDEDHYGAGFAFHFGSRDTPGVGKAMDAYAKRTGRDAGHAFAIGDADAILARIAEYVDAGVSKFILRPLGGDDEHFCPDPSANRTSAAARGSAWPKHPKTSDQ